MHDQQKKTEQPQEHPEAAPLSREQLRNLLSDFLGQLTTTKPPTPAIVEQPKDNENQQADGPTLDELHQAWKEGGDEMVDQVMVRADGKKMVPSPRDLALAYQKGGKELVGALMENMDGDEDGPDPEWKERRWR
jgi:hypothetical protein